MQNAVERAKRRPLPPPLPPYCCPYSCPYCTLTPSLPSRRLLRRGWRATWKRLSQSSGRCARMSRLRPVYPHASSQARREACPISTEGGTRRVLSVQEGGRWGLVIVKLARGTAPSRCSGGALVGARADMRGRFRAAWLGPHRPPPLLCARPGGPSQAGEWTGASVQVAHAPVARRAWRAQRDAAPEGKRHVRLVRGEGRGVST